MSPTPAFRAELLRPPPTRARFARAGLGMVSGSLVTMHGGNHYVRDVIDRLDALTIRDRLSVADILLAFGRTAFLPLLLVPALLVVSPLSGIPFFSSFCGLTIGLIASQMLARRDRLWLPEMLTRRTLSGARLHRGTNMLRGLADRLDALSRVRLIALTVPPLSMLLHLSCMICGLAMPMLEVMPFSSSILGLAVVLFVVALLARDGLLAVAGWLAMGLAGLVPVVLLSGIAG